jgi:hypothetical protein
LVIVTTLTTEGTRASIFFALAVASPASGVVGAAGEEVVVGVLVDGLAAGVVPAPHPVRAKAAAAMSVLGSPTFMVCLSWLSCGVAPDRNRSAPAVSSRRVLTWRY